MSETTGHDDGRTYADEIAPVTVPGTTPGEVTTVPATAADETEDTDGDETDGDED